MVSRDWHYEVHRHTDKTCCMTRDKIRDGESIDFGIIDISPFLYEMLLDIRYNKCNYTEFPLLCDTFWKYLTWEDENNEISNGA